jgi:hypothetical protein
MSLLRHLVLLPFAMYQGLTTSFPADTGRLISCHSFATRSFHVSISPSLFVASFEFSHTLPLAYPALMYCYRTTHYSLPQPGSCLVRMLQYFQFLHKSFKPLSNGSAPSINTQFNHPFSIPHLYLYLN